MPGWVVLPLRAFLGVTFTFAGLQKLADHNYFDSSSPSSVQAQMRSYARTSPIHGVVTFASHHAFVVGLLIALGELAVGIGTLLGLWTRIAAVGGMLLSLSFLLTASWHSHPYYLGPDIVFLFAWTPLVVAGAGDVLALDGVLAARARRQMRLPAAGPVAIEFAVVRLLCGQYDDGRCRARDMAVCDPGACPVLDAQPRLRPATAEELDRRTFLAKSSVALRVGAVALGVGGVTAALGRALAPSSRDAARAVPRLGGATSSSPTTPAPAPTAAPPTTATAPPHPAGTAIGPASAVPVGGAASFTDPRTGGPAYVVQPASGQFVAFSAVCTHQGCTVDAPSSGRFHCPCHGAVFDARSGAVLQGPARRPLPTVPVQAGGDGLLYVT